MGSHGGQLPGCIAIRKFARAVILNDAGVGLDKAGISSLELCEKIKMAAATVSSMSCRIGNGYDMVERGIISYVNLSGAKLGVHEGMSCKIAIAKFVQANVAIQREFSNFREVTVFSVFCQRPRTPGLQATNILFFGKSGAEDSGILQG